MTRGLALPALLAGALLAGPAVAADDAALAQCAAVADAAARLACYDALVRRPASPQPAATPTPPPAPGDFGLPRHSTPEERAGVTAHVVGPLREWAPGALIRLDNGQVWKVVGEDSGYYPNIPDNAEVAIKQSFFGGYWMEITAIGRKVKVKRIS